MTPEAKKIVEAFLNENSYKFQLSVASGIVGASSKDVTNWRQRHQLPFSPDKIGGRFFVTNKGFIAIGIMSELAWALGPDVASNVAKTVINDLFLSSPFQYNVEDFSKMSFEFQKPLSEDVMAALDNPKMLDDNYSPLGNGGFRISYQSGTSRIMSHQRATISVPIGLLVAKWATSHAWATKTA